MKKGTFTSVWDDAIIITGAELNEITGEIMTSSIDTGNNGSLIEEFFEDEDGDQLEVCPECHCYIMKTIMVDGIDHCYNERSVCSDPDCESNL
jgi:hypothetical protein